MATYHPLVFGSPIYLIGSPQQHGPRYLNVGVAQKSSSPRRDQGINGFRSNQRSYLFSLQVDRADAKLRSPYRTHALLLLDLASWSPAHILILTLTRSTISAFIQLRVLHSLERSPSAIRVIAPHAPQIQVDRIVSYRSLCYD